MIGDTTMQDENDLSLIDLLIECLPVIETAATDPLYSTAGQRGLLKLARAVHAAVQPHSNATFQKVHQ
jgi:hypothetical protein